MGAMGYSGAKGVPSLPSGISAKLVTSPEAGVAQLVEQLIRNQQVIGSSPIAGSNLRSLNRYGASVGKPVFSDEHVSPAYLAVLTRASYPIRVAKLWGETSIRLRPEENCNRRYRQRPFMLAPDTAQVYRQGSCPSHGAIWSAGDGAARRTRDRKVPISLIHMRTSGWGSPNLTISCPKFQTQRQRHCQLCRARVPAPLA